MKELFGKKTAEITVGYDKKSYMVNRKRIFINSGSVHYFRLPRAEWREVLMKAKLAGLNCIDTYFAWNFHEPMEGEWEFDGEKDCGYFLDLCAELKLYVIARPGPFICAEWDFGGFPWWLSAKPGIKYRENNPIYLTYVNRYFDQIIPIIASRQITTGGSVILVQVENEYSACFPEKEHDHAYLDHLREGIRTRGINVPLISSGGTIKDTVECLNFWSGADRWYGELRKRQPNAPVMVTEFWSGWFEHWGGMKADVKTPALLEKRMMELLRTGFTGINHYMFYGGTNFGSFGGRTERGSRIFMTTSYDYHAQLNEYGEPTPKYYVTKRLTYFINCLAGFLSEAIETECRVETVGCCSVRERIRGTERLLFVENPDEERGTFHIILEDERRFPITVDANRIAPLLVDYQLMPGISLCYNGYIVGFEMLHEIPTLILTAGTGRRSWLEITADKEIDYTDDTPVLYHLNSQRRKIAFDLCHFRDTQVLFLRIGDCLLRLLILDDDTLDRSWWVESPSGRQFVSGCDGLDFDMDGRWRLRFQSRERIVKVFGGECPNGGWRKNPNQGCWERVYDVSFYRPALPVLENWEIAEERMNPLVSREGAEPLDFSSFGQGFGYLLYTTEISSDSDRETTLIFFRLQDPARVYVNGREIGIIRDLFSSFISVPLQQGQNRIDLLVQEMGRFNYTRFLGEPKGCFGPIYLDGKTTSLRKGWRNQAGRDVNLDRPDVDENHCFVYTFLNEGYDGAIITGQVGWKLELNEGAADLSRYSTWTAIHSLDLSAYVKPGENKITMGGQKMVERLDLLLFKGEKRIPRWRTGSIGRLEDEKEWCLLGDGKKDRRPTWFRCRFTSPELTGETRLKLKVRLTGMSKGNVWLNGKDLGRYWQIGPQEDYRIPMSWLTEVNELTLFDEEGRRPWQVRLLWEESAEGTWAEV